MSSYSTTHACPCLTFMLTSAFTCTIVSGAIAVECGSHITAAVILSVVHGRPVLTGHPLWHMITVVQQLGDAVADCMGTYCFSIW